MRQKLIGASILPALFAAALAGADAPPSKYLRFGGLPPAWQLALRTAGDRLQKPGKERLTINGSGSRNRAAGVAFQLVQEIPNLAHYSEPGGPGHDVVFDGSQYGKPAGTPQSADSDLIETLVYDSPSWFLYAPSSMLPIRTLGARFRLNPQAGQRYSGPLYDVYLVTVPVQQPGKVKTQPKLFHVNSNTHLVEMVKYQQADNPATNVQIVLGNWTNVSGNAIPQTIQRFENGVEVLRFDVTSAALGPSVADGQFGVH